MPPLMQTLPQRLLRKAQTNARSAPEFWRSLEELAAGADFQAALADEFPQGASLWNAGELGRRKFIKLLGASLALAGMAGCSRRSREKILPYSHQPENVVPGEPLYFASAMPWEGYARGILVESHMGRPTKIEGNPDHPSSLGAADAITQASILGLYDPSRLSAPTKDGTPRTWGAFEAEWLEQSETAAQNAGSRLAVLFEPSSSPTLHRQLRDLRIAYPEINFHSHSPLRSPPSDPASLPLYSIDSADFILAIESDFLNDLPESLRYARQFARRRRVANQPEPTMTRLFAAESAFTLTGSAADERQTFTPPELIELLQEIDVVGSSASRNPRVTNFARKVGSNLERAAGRSLVIVGPQQPEQAHRLAHSINQRLGNLGRTLHYYPDPAEHQGPVKGLNELFEEAHNDRLDALVILSGDPLYTAPADIDFSHALSRIPWTATLSLEATTTAQASRWTLPSSHFLETWSDLRAISGLATIQQPLIEPLYDSRSIHQLLDLMIGLPRSDARAPILKTWRSTMEVNAFSQRWESALRDGFIADTESTTMRREANPYSATEPKSAYPDSGSELWALFRPDTRIRDGRWFSNAWLQELPKDLSMLVWDNAAYISPSVAKERELANGDIVKLTLAGRSVEAPVWVLPGQEPSCVTLPLGYGQRFDDGSPSALGFDAYRLRDSIVPWNAPGLRMEKTGRSYRLVTTQDHHSMQGRQLVVHGSLQQFRAYPDFVHKELHAPNPDATLYPRWPAGDYSWGMSIDLTTCIGCQACVVACQAENNIPVVGKDQVAVGREMHWMRVDRYFHGDPENPDTAYQPVPCMHCENAPCEVVCPVAATVHGNDGLNEMVYNRCVGTRYCSNNCPYKVRRFNFLDYRKETARDDPVRDLQRNPDVTVRSRGVMEKCTYCVQRISKARISSKKENRRIRDGEIVPACAQACPSEAIVFGDIGDPDSSVSRRRKSPLDYSLLGELNTRPRTTYLAKIVNKETPA